MHFCCGIYISVPNTSASCCHWSQLFLLVLQLLGPVWLRSHGLHYTRLPCPSVSPRVCSDSCPLSQWCHLTISSSVAPFSSCPKSFPASGFFPESALHVRWPGYGSFSFSISPSSEFSGLIFFMIDWLDLLAGTHRVFSSTTVQSINSLAFFTVQLSHPYMTTGKTIALTRQTLSAKWCLCFWICCLGLS